MFSIIRLFTHLSPFFMDMNKPLRHVRGSTSVSGIASFIKVSSVYPRHISCSPRLEIDARSSRILMDGTGGPVFADL